MDIYEQLKAHADSMHKQTFLDTISVKAGLKITEEDITRLLSLTQEERFLALLILLAKDRGNRKAQPPIIS